MQTWPSRTLWEPDLLEEVLDPRVGREDEDLPFSET